MRKKPKNKQKFRMRLGATLEIEGDNAARFEEWLQRLPVGSHGPAISEWNFTVEIACGIKAQVKMTVPSWDDYRAESQTNAPMYSMNLKDVPESFQNYLESRGQKIEALLPVSGIAAMIAFYRVERVENCALEDDGDMLLFQWGTNDWGQGEWFELNITRQFIESQGEDSDIWQLSLTWKYLPSDALKSIVAGNKWYSHLQEVTEFETYISQSAAFRALAEIQPETVELSYFCAG